MSQLSVKINLDANAFSDGIKQAAASTKEYTNQISSITKNLPNAKREMNMMRKEAASLALAISRMSEAEKQSAEGQALIQHFNRIREEGAKMIDTIGDINAEMRAMASDTAGLDAAKQAVGVFGNTLSSVAGVIGLVTGEEDKMKKAVVAFTTVQSTLNAITSISTALNKSSILVLKTKALQQKAAAMAVKMETIAQNGNVVATKAATIAQKAFNAVAKANPIGLLITALTTVIGLFTLFASGSDEASDSMNNQKKASEELEEQHKKMAETIGEKVAETTTSFLTLQHQWESLKSEAEQKKWIDDNASAFKRLGLNIMTVAQAQKVFVEQADDVLKLMQLMGRMAGLEAAQMEIWKDYYTKKVVRERGRTVRQYTEAGDIEKSDYALMKAIGREGVDYVTERVTRSSGSMSAGTYAQYVEEIVKVTDKGVALINKKKQEISDKYNKMWDDAAYKVAENQVNSLNDEWKEIAVNVEETRNGINKAAGTRIVFDPLAYDPYEKSTSRTPKARTTATGKQKQTQTRERTKAQSDEKKNEYKSETDRLNARNKELEKLIDKLGNDKNNLKVQDYLKEYEANQRRIKEISDLYDFEDEKTGTTIKEKLEKQVKEWKDAKEALLTKYDGELDTTKWAAEDQQQWQTLNSWIDVTGQKIENIDQLLDGIKINKLEQLEQDITKIKTDITNAAVEGNTALVEQLRRQLIEKTKEYEALKQYIDSITTIEVDPIAKLIDDKIAELEKSQADLQIQITMTPNLTTVDKAKMKNEYDKQQEELDHWRKAKEDRAAGLTYSIPDVTITSSGSIDTAFDKYRQEVEAKWKLMSGDISSRLKPIVLDDLLFTSEKNLYQAQSSIREWAETGIRQVEEAFDKGLLPRQRAKELIKLFNDELKRNHLDPIKVTIESKASKVIKGITEETFNAIGITNDLVSSYKSLQDTLDSEASGWEKAMAAVQLAQVAYNSIIKSIDMVTQILELLGIMKKSDVAATSAQTAAKQANTEATIENTVATVADIAANQTDAATSMVTTGAKSAEAIANATASGAKVPFPGNLIAIAAGVAAVVAALAMISKFKFADGGVVGGHSYYGDKIIARLNSRELVSNTDQQRRIWKEMNNSQIIPVNSQHVVVEGKIRGSDIILVQKNQNSKSNKAR